MKAYAVLAWTNFANPRPPSAQSGEFSDAQISRWEAAARRARLRAGLAAIRTWLAGKLLTAAITR